MSCWFLIETVKNYAIVGAEKNCKMLTSIWSILLKLKVFAHSTGYVMELWFKMCIFGFCTTGSDSVFSVAVS